MIFLPAAQISPSIVSTTRMLGVFYRRLLSDSFILK
jgi:hypothetical protein